MLITCSNFRAITKDIPMFYDCDFELDQWDLEDDECLSDVPRDYLSLSQEEE